MFFVAVIRSQNPFASSDRPAVPTAAPVATAARAGLMVTVGLLSVPPSLMNGFVIALVLIPMRL